MKRFLFFATLMSSALIGCVSDYEAEMSGEDSKAITFEVGKYKASSRADGDDVTSHSGEKTPASLTPDVRFGTFAYKAPGAHQAHTPYMANVQIGYISSYWAAVSDTYYWPETGHLDFISYAPYKAGTSAGIPVIGHINTSTNNDFNKMEFKNYEIVQGEDLMYSEKAHYQTHNYKTYGFSGVPTLFYHALAKLNFTVAASDVQTTEGDKTIDWQVKVKSIKLGDIYSKGSVELRTDSPDPENGVYKPQTTNWTVYNLENLNVWKPVDDSKINKEWTVEGGQTLHKTKVAFDGAKDYYVLPQQLFSKTQYITIVYTIANKLSTAASYNAPDEFAKTLYFKDYSTAGKAEAWEMGKNITYNIIIDPRGDIIHFDPAVVDWVNEDRTLDF